MYREGNMYLIPSDNDEHSELQNHPANGETHYQWL